MSVRSLTGWLYNSLYTEPLLGTKTTAGANSSTPAAAQLTGLIAGGFQVPSMMEGGASFGHYMRSIRTKGAFGTGGQFECA